MKYLVIIAYCLVTSLSWSQDWRDALDQARSLYKEKNYKKAYDMYSLAQRDAPKNVSFEAELAQAAYKAKDYQKASELYRKNLQQKKNSRSLLNHNLGNSYYQKQEYSKAIDAYKDALRKNPNDNETRYNLALALEKDKKNKKEPQNKPQNNQNPPPKQNNPQNNNQKKQQNNNQNNSPEQTSKDIAKDKTERMLDDLMKKEMDTKKNKNNANAGSNDVQNGKDW
ncbi:MAG: tetratricopeptide repeat protein [Crocinitomicaceae bacterium]|nr:tetratricopeptide repeat protein [Crocinitomicaceae bacterium]